MGPDVLVRTLQHHYFGEHRNNFAENILIRLSGCNCELCCLSGRMPVLRRHLERAAVLALQATDS